MSGSHTHEGSLGHDHGASHGHDHAAGGHGHDHGAGGHGHEHGAGGHEHAGGLRGLVQSIFTPHSHDSADSVDTALESSARGIQAVKISLVALLVTSGLQVLVVLVTNSVALLADTIHNFSDALTAVPLWIAFVLGRRAATKRFTYGYRRSEDLAGIFIVAMIALSAALAGWQAIDRLVNPQPLSNLGLLAAAGIIGFAGNELVALYRIRIGKEIGSAALVADGYHARTDGLTSLAVVVGATGAWVGFPQADPIIGLVITVAILWVLKGAASQVFARLMDAVDPELTEAAEAAAHQPGVEDVTSVRIRWIGHRLEAEAHIIVDCDLPTVRSHAIAEGVRHGIFHAVPKISDVIVHVDPCGHRVTDPHRTTRQHMPATPGVASTTQAAAPHRG
ncbi:MAG: cation diffusion facilitator family transporter [Chloroflexota bacterium]